jgi:hypothetical protein
MAIALPAPARYYCKKEAAINIYSARTNTTYSTFLASVVIV